MRVERLEIENFRNIGFAALTEFDPEMNVIYGNNAQGKTNLLEALFYLCFARAFRTRDDSEIIRRGADNVRLDADITCGESDNPRLYGVEIAFGGNLKKRVELGGVRLKTFTALPFRAVLFSPEDLELAKGGAVLRRRWLDNAVGMLRPKYADTLTHFRKLYENKTRLLREYRPDQRDTLDVFNVQLAKAGAVLIHYRAAFCEKLAPLAAETHSIISGNGESLGFRYTTVSSIENPAGMKPSEICMELLEHQSRHADAEIASGMCLSGAHKDDILLTINGQASPFWSQGQARTAALSLKFTEREFVKLDTGEYPLLLLDDVLSELDSARRKTILSRIGGGQTFVTTCDAAELGNFNCKLFRVKNGVIDCVNP